MICIYSVDCFYSEENSCHAFLIAKLLLLLLPVSENLLWSKKGSNLHTITSITVTPPRCSNSPFLGEGPQFSYNQNIIYASYCTCTVCHKLCAMYCVPSSVVFVLSAMHCMPCTACRVLSPFTFCHILCAVYYIPFTVCRALYSLYCLPSTVRSALCNMYFWPFIACCTLCAVNCRLCTVCHVFCAIDCMSWTVCNV